MSGMVPSSTRLEALRQWAFSQFVARYPGYGELALAFPWVVEDLPPGIYAATNGECIALSSRAGALRPRQFLWLVAHELAHIVLHHTRSWVRAADPRRLCIAMEIEADQNVPENFEPVDPARPRVAQEFRDAGADTLEKIYTRLGAGVPVFSDVDDLRLGSGASMDSTRLRVVAALGSVPGTMPGRWSSLIGKLRESMVPWESVLEQYVSARLGESRLRPDRLVPHYWAMGLPVPAVDHLAVSADLVAAIDSSGSMVGEPIVRCLSQMRGLRGLVDDLDVYIADAAIQSQVHLSEFTDLEIAQLVEETKGFGGTDFRPVLEAVGRREPPPRLLVYLSDLDGVFPVAVPDYDVLWITTRADARPPFGSMLRMDEPESWAKGGAA